MWVIIGMVYVIGIVSAYSIGRSREQVRIFNIIRDMAPRTKDLAALNTLDSLITIIRGGE